jgi:hypothetical protein
MKKTQKIKTSIPHGSHADCSASLTKLTALQAPIAILSVCVYDRPGFYWWEKRYRCRHRHRFYRCVYARPHSTIYRGTWNSAAVEAKLRRHNERLQRLAPWSPHLAAPWNKKWVLSPVSATWVSHSTENPTLTTCLLISSFISDCRWNYVTQWTTLSTALETLHFYKHWPVTLLVHTTPYSSGSLGTDTPYIMQKCHKL